MSQLRRVHLFNCDRTYKFDSVEDLLTKTKVSFDTVEKHNFTLGQMSEMTTKIPSLGMDLAFFVVHANESRLSINEDNAGIGYAKIYRALLQATGGNVIIVIGGDDSYRNEDEEDQVVISRWAKRKISSQFKEEFLDGSKSFIFSWNKRHRPIHEEALRHFFDPSKKGQKFEYQPKPKEGGSSKPAQSLSPKNPFQKAQSMEERSVEDRKFIRSYSVGKKGEDSFFSRTKSAEERGEEDVFSRSYSVGQKGKDPLFSGAKTVKQRTEDRSFSCTYSGQKEEGTLFSNTKSSDQRGEGNLSSRSTDSAEQKIEQLSFADSTTGRIRGNMESFRSEQASTGRTKLKDLAILGCNVSENSIQAVRQVFRDIGPKLKLGYIPAVENYFPVEVKKHLNKNPLKFCVLVVDAETVKDAYGNLSPRKDEYEDLLKTAANLVDEKVIILICNTLSFKSQEDEAIVGQTIERVFNERGNGFVAWLNNGKLSVEPDVLVQFLVPTSAVLHPISEPHVQDTTGRAPVSTSGYSYQPQGDPLQSNLSEWETEHEWNVSNVQQSVPQAAATIHRWHPPAICITGEPVLLRSLLRHGKISYNLEDLQLWDPQFAPPDHINQSLLQKYANTAVTGVTIVLKNNGELELSVSPKLVEISKSRNEGIQIAQNEILQLKTRIREGLVSFQESDVHFRFGNFQIPEEIIHSLREEYGSTPCGVLYIISDEKWNLRSIVKVGKIDRMRTFAKKRGF